MYLLTEMLKAQMIESRPGSWLAYTLIWTWKTGMKWEYGAHLILYQSLLFFMFELVGDPNIEVAIVFSIRCTWKLTNNLIAMINNQSWWRVEYCLPVVSRKHSILNKESKWITTDFQCVYGEWGPVENLTCLWVHLNTISNQARKACTSDAFKQSM